MKGICLSVKNAGKHKHFVVYYVYNADGMPKVSRDNEQVNSLSFDMP